MHTVLRYRLAHVAIRQQKPTPVPGGLRHAAGRSGPSLLAAWPGAQAILPAALEAGTSSAAACSQTGTCKGPLLRTNNGTPQLKHEKLNEDTRQVETLTRMRAGQHRHLTSCRCQREAPRSCSKTYTQRVSC